MEVQAGGRERVPAAASHCRAAKARRTALDRNSPPVNTHTQTVLSSRMEVSMHLHLGLSGHPGRLPPSTSLSDWCSVHSGV